MMKNAEAQNLLDNAYLFTYKALVKCCTKTVVVHTHALHLHRLGKITYLQFLCGKASRLSKDMFLKIRRHPPSNFRKLTPYMRGHCRKNGGKNVCLGFNASAPQPPIRSFW